MRAAISGWGRGVLGSCAAVAASGVAVLVLGNSQPTPLFSQIDRPQRLALGADDALPQPIASTHDLMELFNRPWYERLCQEMQNRPTEQKDWTTLRERGLQAAEIANLIALREPPAGHDQHWKDLALQVQKAGISLAEAAESRRLPELSQAFDQLRQSCNKCHETVRPNTAPQLK